MVEPLNIKLINIDWEIWAQKYIQSVEVLKIGPTELGGTTEIPMLFKINVPQQLIP